MNAADKFRDAIRAAGLMPPHRIEPGRFHRFPGDSKRNGNTAGWCKLFTDERGGIFGDFSTGSVESWQAEPSRVLTPVERDGFREHVERARAEAESTRREEHEQAAAKAAAIWKAAEPAPADHPYLTRKGVAPYGLRLHKGTLVIPLRDTAEDLHSLQFIGPHGEKRFLSGGRVAGCYFSIGATKDAKALCIAEGFATGASIHEATGYPVAVAFTAGNLEAMACALHAKFPELTLILCADDDIATDGNRGLTKATAAARAVGGILAVPDFGTDRPDGAKDFNDLAAHRGADAVQRCIEAGAKPSCAPPGSHLRDRPEPPGRVLRAVSLADFLALDIHPPEPLLGTLITKQSLAMVFAWRGIGKTWFSLCAAYAVASGGMFLRWAAERPHRVLYLDGEMPAASMQKRLATITDAATECPPDGFFQLVTPDLCGGLVPDLATYQGQAHVDALVAETRAEFVVLDNLSCWVRSGGAENEAESWRLMSEWLLRHRSAGRAVLLVHHAGKNLAQRGTSKKEDILDVCLDLRRPPNYDPEQGAAFAIEFGKARHMTGDQAEPFEACLTTDEHGKAVWTMTAVKESTFDRVVELAGLGLTQKEISDELGINKSNVSRHWNKAVERGLIKPKRPEHG